MLDNYAGNSNWAKIEQHNFDARDGTLVGYTFSKRYKKVSPHRKSHNLLYNLLKEKNKPPQEMVNKRGVPFGPTWLTRTLDFKPTTAIYAVLWYVGILAMMSHGKTQLSSSIT